MASNLPRGIQIEKWKNKDKSVSIRYRVRIVRKDLQENRAFDTLEQAKDFLNLAKTHTGRAKIFDEDLKQKALNDFLLSPPLSVYINAYIEDYVNTKTKETELQKRSISNILSFYKTIEKTEIEERIDGLTGVLSLTVKNNKRPFGSFKVSQIDGYSINSYIKTRLAKGIKKISVSREITHISKLFQKLRFIDKSFEKLVNPATLYDRELLANKTNVKKFRFTDEQEEKLFKALEAYPNPHMKQIILLSLLTGMRRSEVCTLEWSMIKNGYIQLESKGRSRKVHLMPEAKDLLSIIEKTDSRKVFYKYGSIAGFEGSFCKFMHGIGLKEITFHCFRKESISRFISLIGNNSIVLTEILGIQNVRKFEETHMEEPTTLDTQQGILKSVGHSSSQITKGFYFGIKERK